MINGISLFANLRNAESYFKKINLIYVSNNGFQINKILEYIFDKLKDLGYYIDYGILDTAEYEMPQKPGKETYS